MQKSYTNVGAGGALGTDGGNRSKQGPTGAGVDTGLSMQEKCPKGYAPRDSGQGERPAPPMKEKAGPYTIR